MLHVAFHFAGSYWPLGRVEVLAVEGACLLLTGQPLQSDLSTTDESIRVQHIHI